MTRINVSAFLVIFIFSSGIHFSGRSQNTKDNLISEYIVNPHKLDVQIFWKDSSGKKILRIQRLDSMLFENGRNLLFAMNGGMFTQDYSPVGLLIVDGKVLKPLNICGGDGNFFLKPNGVFYLTTDKKAGVCKSEDFEKVKNVEFATQSGPMLLIDNLYHPSFKVNSQNFRYRNGVGILPDGNILFAITNTSITFYQFATFFKRHGCKNALFLDGEISEMYLPEKGMTATNKNFGAIIGVSERKSK